MRSTIPALLWLSFAAAAAAQGTDPVPEPNEAPPCDVPEPVLFAKVDGRIENLEFADGILFVTAFEKGLYRIDPGGNVTHVAKSDRTRAPTEVGITDSTAWMGVAQGADGALYVAEGLGAGQSIPARVVRFPVPGEPAFEVFAEGFDGANGLAADADGNLYLAHGFDEELWRIAPDGPWEVWTRVPDVVNGVDLRPDGSRLVIAPIGDASNPAVAIPLGDPDAREVLVRFAAPPSANGIGLPDPSKPLFAKGIDDLTVAPDGRVLASGHFRMQFLMGDPATGEVCVLLDGARGEPSSIRVAEGFGSWDGWAFTTDFSGDVWAVDLGAAEADGGEAPVAEDVQAETPAPGWLALAALAAAALTSLRASR